ncbi:MAG: hypothetical protein ABI183_27430 [Polyangiaceae bacterium]
MPNADARPISRPLIGAVLAACVITSLPGLTLALSSFEQSAPDLRSSLVEIILGGIAAVFGSLQIQAQTRSSGKWIGLAPLGALAVASFVIGIIFLLSVGTGSVDSGPFLVLGFLALCGVVAAQIVLAVIVWVLLASLVKGLDNDAASGIDPNVRASRWLGIAAIVHVVMKCVSGGPALFGLGAAILAVTLALRAKQNLGLVLGGLSIAAAVSTTLGVRMYYAHNDALARIPLCEEGNSVSRRESGIVARDVRAMPGVAEVLVFSRSPFATPQLSVVVLPVGGGPIPPTLRRAIEQDVVASGCAVDDRGTKPIITVEDPKYTEIPVLARVHLAPGANEEAAKKAITDAVRAMFYPHVDANLISTRSGGGYMPATPQDVGVQLVEWRSGSDTFDTRINQLEIGAVPTLGKFEIEIVADQ